MSLAQYSKEQLKELSLIEMAYEYLKNSKQPIAFNDLVKEIATAADISDQEIRSRLAQFYTEINIDGHFLSLGENRWGLRVWYPVDTVEEEIVTVVKPKKKKAKKVVDEEDLEDYEDLEDEDYEDLDDFVEEDDLLDDEEEDFDEIDEVDDEFEDEAEDVIEEDEEFELGEDEDLTEDLDDDEVLIVDEEEDEEDEEEKE